jgi:hypothetical protein
LTRPGPSPITPPTLFASAVWRTTRFSASFAIAKDKPKAYQEGKLLDLTVEDVSRGSAIIGGMAAPIPGRLYVFRIQLGGLVYMAEYKGRETKL